MMIIFHDDFEITCFSVSYPNPTPLIPLFLINGKFILKHQGKYAKIVSQNYPRQLKHAQLITINIYIPVLIVITLDRKIAKNII